MNEVTVIIVAGGSGIRMGASKPKQFLLLQDRPILVHTIQRFWKAMPDAKFIIVLPENQHGEWEQIRKKYPLPQQLQVCNGGFERFFSVKNGLNLVLTDAPDKIIAVHDAVRPLVSIDVIQRCISTAADAGAAVPIVPVVESLRQINVDGTSAAVARKDFVVVQTPQCFKVEILLKSYEQPYRSDFTDDASVVENAGFPVTLVEGNTENFKITSPSDLLQAEILLAGEKKS